MSAQGSSHDLLSFLREKWGGLCLDYEVMRTNARLSARPPALTHARRPRPHRALCPPHSSRFSHLRRICRPQSEGTHIFAMQVRSGVAIVSLGGAEDTATEWGTKTSEHRLNPAAVLALMDTLARAERDSEVPPSCGVLLPTLLL